MILNNKKYKCQIKYLEKNQTVLFDDLVNLDLKKQQHNNKIKLNIILNRRKNSFFQITKTCIFIVKSVKNSQVTCFEKN